ncbi:MAG: AsmA family protein [Bacteroidales bacterium]|nr:AsmA family protein [Bacteroidales bacterium]
MKRFSKILLGFVIAIFIVLIFLTAFPFLFKNKVANAVRSVANSHLKTELNFSDMELSFFKHFPHLTLRLKDFSLKGSSPFEKDTLVVAKEVSFGVDVMSLFGKTIEINRVFLDRARIEIRYNEAGANNFDVYQLTDTVAAKTDTSVAGSAEINIEDINFSNCRFIYDDPSIPLNITVNGFNYKGKSQLSKDILSLKSDIQVDSFNLQFNHRNIIRSKPLEAKLTTKINTNNLNVFLEKNDLKIKDMPVNFNGRFNFLKDGYSLNLRLLSIYNNEVFSAAFRLNSTDQLYIFARINTSLDLAKWSKAIGLDMVDLRGMFNFNLNAEGIYESDVDGISSIPKFTVSSRLTNGYLKYRGLPQALTNISFDLNAGTPDNNYRHTWVSLEKLKAGFLKNKIEGAFHLRSMVDFPVEAILKTSCNLAELKQVIPMDSLELSGILDVDANVNGKYAPEKKLFPLSTILLNLKEGIVQTKFYPHPIEKINVSATITNGTGDLKDTRVTLAPLTFLFEENPFEINADIKNPGNVSYQVKAKGILDIARIYKVFAQKGLDLDGHIEADLILKGLQHDAMAGHYERLHNKGSLILRNIGFTSENLPKKIVLRDGVFRFDNDNIWFERFIAKYGSSDIRLDGHLKNVVNYVLSDKQKLKGNFSFTSSYLFVDEFMAPVETNQPVSGTNSPSSKPATALSKPVDSPVTEGVIVIPSTLEIGLQANLKRIRFRGVDIQNLVAAAEIRDGMVLLKGMQFTLVGTQVGMDASYGSMNPSRAFFDFHVTANDFDVKRAYTEIALFRELASAAAHAEGIISLDYSLKGELIAGMNPVFPSLEGGGVISLKKVKVMGLKLFTVISKNTEKEKLKNPDLSKVDLKTTILNNVITLEQTKMKIAGFRLKVSGTTNFNGQLSLKMRIGLPPLGIFGIPLRALGTTDNPKLKYGRGSSDAQVEETEYSDEMPADLKMKLKNAKETDIGDKEPDSE